LGIGLSIYNECGANYFHISYATGRNLNRHNFSSVHVQNTIFKPIAELHALELIVIAAAVVFLVLFFGNAFVKN